MGGGVHRFAWDSIADLGVTNVNGLLVRLTAVGGGTEVSGVPFSVFNVPTPVVTSLTVTTGATTSPTSTTVLGSGFQTAGAPVLDVTLDDVVATPLTFTVISDTQIDATVPPDVAVGVYNVRVRNESGLNTTSPLFAVVARPRATCWRPPWPTSPPS